MGIIIPFVLWFLVYPHQQAGGNFILPVGSAGETTGWFAEPVGKTAFPIVSTVKPVGKVDETSGGRVERV
jgi:hypothetical protein